MNSIWFNAHALFIIDETLDLIICTFLFSVLSDSDCLTRAKYEELCTAEFGQFSQMLGHVLSICKLQNVSGIMFAGGSSRLQWFKREVEQKGTILAN